MLELGALAGGVFSDRKVALRLFVSLQRPGTGQPFDDAYVLGPLAEFESSMESNRSASFLRILEV